MKVSLFVKWILLITLFLGLASCTQPKAKQSPKNIIVFISDGCGYNHVKAAGLFEFGAEGKQVYQQFPVRYAMSTFPADGIGYDPQKAWADFGYVLQKPTDSAASATALSSGIKTKNGILGMDSTFTPVENIVERAEKAGKATGVVTTVPFDHATPAGFVAHNKSRGNYPEIAHEMIFQSGVDVIMGAGHPQFDEDGKPLDQPNFKYISEEDWKILVAGKAGNDADGDGSIDYWKYIEKADDFRDLVWGETPKRVFGLAEVASTLQENRSGDAMADAFTVPFIKNVPTLKQMTLAAINVLDEDKDGFFLMVEGGAVDWASHANRPGRLIEEEMDFNKAVRAAVQWVEQNSSWDETLIIVTGDHETGYLTGPGANPQVKAGQSLSVDQIWTPLVNNGKGKMPGMEFHTRGHTNSLIPFFAKGVGSELFNKETDGSDPVRGAYIDNSDVGKVLKALWE